MRKALGGIALKAAEYFVAGLCLSVGKRIGEIIRLPEDELALRFGKMPEGGP